MASPITPDVALANLQSTALTARCHNVFFRQKQLKSLHDTLRSNATSVKNAIKQDNRMSDAEATTEVALALDAVREHYSSLDFKKELEEEYRITNKKNAVDWRDPWGVVYLEPQRNHTHFFSVVVALSAALAAGNCVALKVREPSTRHDNCAYTVSSLRITSALCRPCFGSYSQRPSKPIPLRFSPPLRPQTRCQLAYRSSKKFRLRRLHIRSLFRHRARSLQW